MPGVRSLLVAALGLCLIPAGSAGATVAVKTVCHVIADDPADASGAGLLGADPGLDIASADLASNDKAVTVAIRLSGPPPRAGSLDAPEGVTYRVVWAVPGSADPVYLSASSDETGSFRYAMGHITTSPAGNQVAEDIPGPVDGAVNGAVITLGVRRPVLAGVADVAPGKRLTDLQALASVPLGVPGVVSSLQPADSAVGAAYVAGTPSCLKVLG